jgi:hypothetical protein
VLVVIVNPSAQSFVGENRLILRWILGPRV